MRSISK